MRFGFRHKRLEDLYTEERDARRYPDAVVQRFFDVIGTIAAAKDERDLYAIRGLRFEKLPGDRAGQHSLRLGDQWRLIVTLEDDDRGRCLVVEEIVDYHR